MSTQGSNAQYYILSVGTLINISAYVGILTLQSSLNIADSVGTTCASILYACALVLLLLFTPYMLSQVGPKWSLVLGEFGFVVYTLGNFYPSFYTMIPAAVIGSFGEALLWSSSTLYVAQLVKAHWSREANPRENLDSLRNKWFGHFFATLKSCQIFGNVLSYAVLYGARNLNVDHTNKTTPSGNYSTCGSRYCLQSGDADNDRYKYIPKSKVSMYLLIGIYASMQAFAIVLHSVFLAKLPKSSNATSKRVVLDSIKTSFQHMISVDSCLVTPTGFYYGLVVGYAASNFTQAFVSCTIGVQQVGLVMVIYGATNVLSSFLVGRLAHRFSLRPVIACSFAYDLFSWTVQMLWRPTTGSIGWVYVIGGLLGVSDGVWQTTSASVTGEFFSDRAEVAFGTLSFFTVLGLFVSFFISGRICVKVHIAILYAVLTAVSVGYAVAEWRRSRRKVAGDDSEERAKILESTDDNSAED